MDPKRRKTRSKPGDQNNVLSPGQPPVSSQLPSNTTLPTSLPGEEQSSDIPMRPSVLGIPTAQQPRAPQQPESPQRQGYQQRPEYSASRQGTQQSSLGSSPSDAQRRGSKFLDRLPTLDGVVSKIWKKADSSKLYSNLSEFGLYALAYTNGALASNNAYMALTEAAQNYGMTTQPNWGNVPVIAQTGGMFFLEKLADAMKRKSTSQIANTLGTVIQIGVTASESILGVANLVVAAYYTPITGAALRGIIDYISPGESLELDLMLFPIYQGNPTVPFFIGLANLYAARQEKDYGTPSRRTPSSYKRTEPQVGSSPRSAGHSFLDRFKR